MTKRLGSARFFVTVSLVAAISGGCAGRQMVDADVPLRRVVLYRNGVGYFERQGRVSDDHLRFRVRREHVGDFLATLAVIDRDGHARSVSFPTIDEGEDGDELVNVDLRLGGSRHHDITVAYVVETPIWRPSYRIVLEEGRALLQGWAVVQNLSGEDWTDVRMSVTSGAPMSFRSDLGQPIIPPRPTITDTGEIVAAPIHGEIEYGVPEAEWGEEERLVEEAETTAAPAAAAAPAPPAAAPARMRRSRAAADTGGVGGLTDDEEALGGGRFGRGPATEQEEPSPMDLRRLLGSVGPLARGSVQEGVTRYDVADLVTVPDGGSTMVAIINQTVPGEDALLFRPDPSAPETSIHPMRVVRLTNDSGVLLERGPVAIYSSGTLLGQGLLDPLPAGATASIPFAIERALSVETASRSETSVGRLVKIAHGRITIEQYSQRSTTYRIRNGLDRHTTLYIRHQRVPNWEVVDPPEGTEEVENALLLPVRIEDGDTELQVVERTPTRRVLDLMSDLAAQAVALYLQGPAVDAAAGPVLRRALERRERLMENSQQRARLDAERRELRSAQADVRRNLAAIHDIARARDLRERLTRRLDELSRRIDALTNQIVELDSERSELRVRLAEDLRDLTLDLDHSDSDSSATH